MWKKTNKILFLGLCFIPIIFGNITSFGSDFVITKSKGEQEQIIKTNNPNNNKYVDYNDANNFGGIGNKVKVDVEENGYKDNVVKINSLTSLTINIKSEDLIDDFSNDLERVWFTLYDTTNNNMEVIDYYNVERSQIWWGYPEGRPNSILLDFRGEPELKTSLEDFHTYKLGFNINKNDDMEAYSDNFSLTQPVFNSFALSSTENNILVEWDFISKFENINFDFKQIYLKVNNKKYDLGTNGQGQYIVKKLSPKKDYLVAFGYQANKVLSNGKTYEITKENNFKVSTKMPKNFSSQTIIVSAVLLAILLLIILVLGFIILYWNQQRKKISGLALVSDESNNYDDNSYWNNNENDYYGYGQEQDYPHNQSSNNYGNEIDEYQDWSDQSNDNQSEEIEEWIYE